MSDAAANDRAKNAAMAAYMKQHPNDFPDSVMKEPHIVRSFNGVAPAKSGSTWERGMLGGVLAKNLGYGSYGTI